MLLRCCLALLAIGSTASAPPAPPFTFNIDQTMPCPHGSTDYSIAAPLADPTASVLQAALVDLPALLQAKLKELHCPGIAVVVTQGGRVIHEAYAGSAKLHSQAVLNASTGTEIASITKTFTATMLFMLRDAGKLGPLGLDTPVSHLMPEFSIRSPYPSGRGVTLRSLVMHVSGLPREIPRGTTESEILEAISELTVLSPQFAQAHYSNLGLALLGRALQRAANTTWEDFVATEILLPLGMRDSGNPPFKADVLGRMAEGVTGSGELVKLPTHTTWGSPCGSMHSSPRDMVKWMNFHMDVGTAEDKAVFATVLDPATRMEMHSTGFLLGDGLAGVSSSVFETAFIHGRRTASKLGNNAGYRSSMTMVPDLALGIFATATSTGDLWGDGDAVGFPVASKIIPAVEELLIAQDMTSLSLPNASFLEAISGLYCTADRNSSFARTVELEQIPVAAAAGAAAGDAQTVQALVMRHSGSPSMVLRYEGGNSFRQTMGPEDFMPFELAPCHDANAPEAGQNLCPLSCGRRLFRGSGELLEFEIDQRPGEYHGLMGTSGAFVCHKYHPAPATAAAAAAASTLKTDSSR